MAHAPLPLLARRGWGETMRRDAWWVYPLVVFIVLGAFVVYATWAALQGRNYIYGPYLSPFYSPILFGTPEIAGTAHHAWFSATAPSWWPGFLTFSPALLILPFPAFFRFTCYYYRGAYYKGFWADPSNCAVGEPRNSYLGERYFPLILQNVHRYFWYIAVIFIFILAKDAWDGLWFTGADGAEHFGLGVGSLVLIANVILLGGYTFGCHSARHIVGGFRDVMAGRPVTQQTYRCVSCLNRGHQNWAWCSLVMVGFADIYVRMCAMGVWHDFRFF